MAKQQSRTFDRGKTPAILEAARANASEPVRYSTVRAVRELWPVVVELRRQGLGPSEIATWLVDHADLPVTPKTVSRAITKLDFGHRRGAASSMKPGDQSVTARSVAPSTVVPSESVDGSAPGSLCNDAAERVPVEGVSRPTFRRSLNGAPNTRFRDL